MFKALLNMDGLGDVPTFEAILQNDLGGIPVWAIVAGNIGYSLTLAGAFPAGQTLVTCGSFVHNSNPFYFDPLLGPPYQPDSLVFVCPVANPGADQFALTIEVFPVL